MRVHWGYILPTVGMNSINVIDRQVLIWIDSNKYNTYITYNKIENILQLTSITAKHCQIVNPT